MTGTTNEQRGFAIVIVENIRERFSKKMTDREEQSLQLLLREATERYHKEKEEPNDPLARQ